MKRKAGGFRTAGELHDRAIYFHVAGSIFTHAMLRKRLHSQRTQLNDRNRASGTERLEPSI